MLADDAAAVEHEYSTGLPTVADVIALPIAQRGRPEVLAGGQLISRRVRWLHVSELSDIADLLSGGELILTTGIALPSSDYELERYVEQLVSAGASGLILEYGRRFPIAPRALVQACARNDLPFIVLHRQVEFVRLTEAVHARILERQMALLRASERAHEVFTALAVGSADVGEIVQATAKLTGAAVVFENPMRHVVAFDAADLPIPSMLSRWESRSRAARCDRATGICGPEEWAVTTVEANGEVLGRLILLSAGRPTDEQLTVLKRAATAVTLNRLSTRDRNTLQLQAQRSVLADIIEGRFAVDTDILARTDAMGIALRGRTYVAVVIELRGGSTHGRHKDITVKLVDAVRSAGASALATTWPDGAVGALVALNSTGERCAVLTGLSETLRSRSTEPLSIAAGSSVSRLKDVRRSFVEANYCAMSAEAGNDERPYRELPDAGIQGLLYTISGDPRLHAFVTRTLDPLLAHDALHGTDLLSVLTTYLDCYGNKSETARSANLSRTALYERLEAIERVLQVELTSGEVCTSLHAAVMARRAEIAAARSAAVAVDRHLRPGASSEPG